MRGMIHGIWLTQPGGKLHPQIIPNLSAWVADALANDFNVVLWTNLDQIAPEEVQRLKAAKILVADHDTCKASPLYKYFYYFLQKGIAGDTTAFAIASDILRVAILDLTNDNSYFIYVDPNDTKLSDLSTSLKNIDANMGENALGFSFKVELNSSYSKTFDTRNDVLIALKARNVNFFKEYLNAYWINLERHYKSYFKPTTVHQAQQLAILISNQITPPFIRVDTSEDGSSYVISQFGNYKELYQKVNTAAYLKAEKITQHGDTWLPAAQNDTAVGLDVSEPNINIFSIDYIKRQLADDSEFIGFASGIGIVILAVILWRVINRYLIRAC